MIMYKIMRIIIHDDHFDYLVIIYACHYLNYYYQIVAAIERKGRCDTVQGFCNGLENHRDQ